jgi:hypothetical protein
MAARKSARHVVSIFHALGLLPNVAISQHGQLEEAVYRFSEATRSAAV